jgi:hypothetical protein
MGLLIGWGSVLWPNCEIRKLLSDQNFGHTSFANCQPGVRNIYDGPAYWLGFLVVAEVTSLQE